MTHSSQLETHFAVMHNDALSERADVPMIPYGRPLERVLAVISFVVGLSRKRMERQVEIAELIH
jgi:hypothetical protein